MSLLVIVIVVAFFVLGFLFGRWVTKTGVKDIQAAVDRAVTEIKDAVHKASAPKP